MAKLELKNAKDKGAEIEFNPNEDSKETSESVDEKDVDEKDVDETEKDASDEDVSVKLKSTEKSYKVKIARNHTCHIGGKTYHFKKGEICCVNDNVKRILSNANLLSAI